LIRPGETVLLKPNLVRESHPRDSAGWRYVLTHGSVIRALGDYVFKALEGRGKVILADAPQTDSSFQAISSLLGLPEIQAFYRGQGLAFEVRDLRQQEWVNRGGVIVARHGLAGDPEGYVEFDLGASSEFVWHPGGGHYYGADYDSSVVNAHHTGGRHSYLLARTSVSADVVFSIPKLKTHKKAGITVSLKNLVGVNGDKNRLPHHTEAGPEFHGDEHPAPNAAHRFERAAVRQLNGLAFRVPGVGPWLHRQARRAGSAIFGDTEEVIRSGNWWGNDTVWRMCLDLNKLVSYGDPDGTLRPAGPAHRKRHFVLVDGIVAGEGRGPMNPDPVPAGLVLFGLHPPSVDAAAAWLMGFDPDRIPIVRQAFSSNRYPLAEWGWRDVRVVSNCAPWNAPIPEIPDGSTYHFRPHFGWKGRIEREPHCPQLPAAALVSNVHPGR
jgi:uncharacterized protein (DUF362 family)